MTRIIAGAFRGRSLSTPKGDKTRPTSDRTREALFSALAVWAEAGGAVDSALEGLSFLDLFAGSGAIGLEAASRGASPVTLVEKDRAVAALIKGNAKAVGADVTVVAQSADTFAATAAARPFDVVWLDPPYAVASADLDALIATLVANGYVADDGLVVVERASRSEPLRFGAEFAEPRVRRYGDTTLTFAEREIA